MKVHAATGSRTHADVLFNLGRVFHMTVFCSLWPIWGMGYVTISLQMVWYMYSGLLTVATADNINYNPSTAGAKISLMQQHRSDDFEGNI